MISGIPDMVTTSFASYGPDFKIKLYTRNTGMHADIPIEG
jgi:hypothetical protein